MKTLLHLFSNRIDICVTDSRGLSLIRAFFICLVGITNLCSLSANASSQYIVSDIDVSAASSITATDINDQSQISGWYIVSEDADDGVGTTRAFLHQNGITQDLHSQLDFHPVESIACSINDSGQVVGAFYLPSAIGTKRYGLQAFVYANGSTLNLHTRLVNSISPSITSSVATSINRYGEVVGYYEIDYNPRKRHIFLYSSLTGEVKSILGTVTVNANDGSDDNEKRAGLHINDYGQITGQIVVTHEEEEHHAFLYSTGIFHDLHYLMPAGAVSSNSHSINNQGQVVGEFTDESGVRRAFLYDNGTIRNLSSLFPLDAKDSYAIAINDAGCVFGNYEASVPFSEFLTTHSFLYSPVTNQMEDISGLIRQSEGIYWWEPKSINNAGQLIIDAPERSPFLLTPVSARTWEPHLPIAKGKRSDSTAFDNGRMTAPQDQRLNPRYPKDGQVRVQPGARNILCAVTEATDWDKWTRPSGSSTPPETQEEKDEVVYTWTCSDGYFLDENGQQVQTIKGRTAMWNAPTLAATPTPTPIATPYPDTSPTPVSTPTPLPQVTLTCTIDDKPLDVISPDTGDRDDKEAVVRSTTVVIDPNATEDDRSTHAGDGVDDGVVRGLEFISDRSAVAAGGWDDTRSDYVYLEKASGQILRREAKPDPHIATATTTFTNDNGEALSGRTVTFEWDMPGPAPKETRTATTDANGKAEIDIVSGDEISKGFDDDGRFLYNRPVKVVATMDDLKQVLHLDVVKAKDNWSPLEVQPDQQGDPTIRITLTHDGLPVTGHPISWSIHKVVDEDGTEVAPEDYADYATISGDVSTTDRTGMAAAYLKFGSSAGTITYAASDGAAYLQEEIVTSSSSASTAPSAGGVGSRKAGESPTVGNKALSARALTSSRKKARFFEGALTYTDYEFEADEPVKEQEKLNLNRAPQLFMVYSRFNFTYTPEPGSSNRRSSALSGTVNMTMSSSISNKPLEISVPLNGGAVTARVAGKAATLSSSEAEYYKTFALEFLKQLTPDKVVRQTNCVIEGYGLFAWDTIKQAPEIVKLPLTLYQGRKQIAAQASRAITVTIDGVTKFWSDPDVAGLANKAAGVMSKSLDDMVIYAAKNPQDFGKKVGYGAAGVSFAVATRRFSVTKTKLGNVVVPGTKKLVGRAAIGASTRLTNIRKSASVLLRVSDTKRFKPALSNVLGSGRSRRWRQGANTFIEGDTNHVVAASSSGWTARLKVRMNGGNTNVVPGTIKTFCFPSGTLIAFGDGSLRPIEKIKVGDEVISRDEKTMKTSIEKVTRLFHRIAQRTVKLRFTNGETIEATPEHPFYVPSKGFRPAGHLMAGALIATLSDQPLQVQSIEYSNQAKTVYNFSVANTQTYFVGQSSLWVHNQCRLTSNLRFVSIWRQSLPNVVKHDIPTVEEFRLAKKVSSFRRGALLHGEINPPTGTLSGFDGWWRTAETGVKYSAKETLLPKPIKVMEQIKVALKKARDHNVDEIDLYINAPNADAKAIFDFIQPNTVWDDFHVDNTIKRVTIFCKDNEVIELAAPNLNTALFPK